jgi:hypothetical protein
MAAMKAVCVSALLCFATSVPFPTLADTWKSSVQLDQEKSTGGVICRSVDVSIIIWELTLQGNTLSGVSSHAGDKFSTTVPADGSVKTTFTSAAAAGPVELTGNVNTRQFEAFLEKAGCRYKWAPVK